MGAVRWAVAMGGGYSWADRGILFFADLVLERMPDSHGCGSKDHFERRIFSVCTTLCGEPQPTLRAASSTRSVQRVSDFEVMCMSVGIEGNQNKSVPARNHCLGVFFSDTEKRAQKSGSC